MPAAYQAAGAPRDPGAIRRSLRDAGGQIARLAGAGRGRAGRRTLTRVVLLRIHMMMTHVV